MSAGVDVDPRERQAIVAGMNLAVLRRQDPSVRAVLRSASHVAVYQLSDADKDGNEKWHRCDIEGSLFIVERQPVGSESAASTKYRMVVINRKSPENYLDDLTPGNHELEDSDQMIMYRNSRGEVTGIWFYERAEASGILKLMRDIVGNVPISELPEEQVSTPADTAPPTKSPEISSKKTHRRSRRSRAMKRAVASNTTQKSTLPELKQDTPLASEENQGQSVPDDSLKRFFPNLETADNGIVGAAMPRNAQDPSVAEYVTGDTRFTTMETSANGNIGHSTPGSFVPGSSPSKAESRSSRRKSEVAIPSPLANKIGEKEDSELVPSEISAKPQPVADTQAHLQEQLRVQALTQAQAQAHVQARAQAEAQAQVEARARAQVQAQVQAQAHAQAQARVQAHLQAQSLQGVGFRAPSALGLPGSLPLMHPSAHYQAMQAQAHIAFMQQQHQHQQRLLHQRYVANIQQHEQLSQQKSELNAPARQSSSDHSSSKNENKVTSGEKVEDEKQPAPAKELQKRSKGLLKSKEPKQQSSHNEEIIEPVLQGSSGSAGKPNDVPKSLNQMETSPRNSTGISGNIRQGEALNLRTSGLPKIDSDDAAAKAGQVLLGMLKQGPQAVGNGPVSKETLVPSINTKGSVSSDPAVEAITSSVASLQMGKKVARGEESVLEKPAFRAVIQRMLTDKKLFDGAYDNYISIFSKKRTNVQKFVE